MIKLTIMVKSPSEEKEDMLTERWWPMAPHTGDYICVSKEDAGQTGPEIRVDKVVHYLGLHNVTVLCSLSNPNDFKYLKDCGFVENGPLA